MRRFQEQNEAEENMRINVFLLMFSSLLIAQEDTQKPCSSAEARQFDFWLGDWEATWQTADDETKRGRNSITSSLGGCVILENFDGRPGNALIGMSVSVYDQNAKKWKQTWVDNSGGYLDFSGDFTDGQMALTREFSTPKGKRIQRMVWYNIGEDEFDWDWKISDDDGKSWKVAWQIHYK
jgi:hypothetical protein